MLTGTGTDTPSIHTDTDTPIATTAEQQRRRKAREQEQPQQPCSGSRLASTRPTRSQGRTGRRSAGWRTHSSSPPQVPTHAAPLTLPDSSHASSTGQSRRPCISMQTAPPSTRCCQPKQGSWRSQSCRHPAVWSSTSWTVCQCCWTPLANQTSCQQCWASGPALRCCQSSPARPGRCHSTLWEVRA